jgi:hypothetical protein
MLKIVLKELNERFKQHHECVGLRLQRPFVEPVFNKYLQYLHPPNLSA